MKSAFIALSAAAIAGLGIADASKQSFFGQKPFGLQTVAEPQFRTLALPAQQVQPTPRTARVPVQTSQAPTETPVPVSADIAVDESALRYFASRGDTARLQAEISRLRALYPNWTPPKDPLAVPQNEDKQLEAMWQLYAQSKFAEVRKAITDRQQKEPSWKPPADLLDRLDVAEARTRLIDASDLKQFDTVVAIGSETPSLLTCSDVDVLWRVAEAFASIDRTPRAKDAYLYILDNCQNPAERLATIQKAAALQPTAVTEELLTREKPGTDGKMEFDGIRDDLARRFVAEANADAGTGMAVPQQYLMRVERLAETGGLASDALLLGWYHFEHKDMNAAEPWFQRARDKQDSASASQGLALTLIARKQLPEAEDVMYTWRDSSKDAKAVYLDATANLLAIEPPVAIKSDVLQRIAAYVVANRDAATAQQFGWYARAMKQLPTAEQWFKTALVWKADDEPSAYGLTITRLQLGDEVGVSEIQQLWAGRSTRIERAGEPETVGEKDLPQTQSEVLATETPVVVRKQRRAARSEEVTVDEQPRAVSQRTSRVAAPRPRSNTAAKRGCTTTTDPQTLAPDAALTRGWCLMDLNRPMEAAAAFDVAARSPTAKSREDAAYGQSLAYLRAGLVGRAAVSATKTPQTRQRMNELQTAILSDKALAAFDGGRYREAILLLDQRAQIADERTDLMVLRGYAYMDMRRYGDAQRIFAAAAAIGNKEAANGYNTINDILRSVNHN